MATNLKPLFKYNANEANKREAILAPCRGFVTSFSCIIIFALAVSLALLCDRLNKIFLLSPSFPRLLFLNWYSLRGVNGLLSLVSL